ncbi:MAG TPA: L-ribulose-5-phosphate 4-epimerase [Clostridiales bacterium]|jgi:L-ribulose-5-phosphate 4-epimerase|nr:L-ribulose-5-phosphate 4-epimerase [Clostridiales bacterium]
MLKDLKREVWEQNLNLVKHNLVIFTWGNVSGIDRQKGIIAIKPSGVEYDVLKPEDIVLVDLDGKIVQGKLNPSSDTPTHIELYKNFEKLGGIVHTHSTYATAWAQAGKPIKCYGTTHADYFYGEIPCTRALTQQEITTDYEKNTGKVIAQTFADLKLDIIAMPAVLIKSHGPFSFGISPKEAVFNAAVLEEVAKMAWITQQINPDIASADQFLLDKHYLRKHGENAYYGQKNKR